MQDHLASIAVFSYWLVILYFYVIGLPGHVLEWLSLFFSTPAFLMVFFKKKTEKESREFTKQLTLLLVLIILGWISSSHNQNSTYTGYAFMILGNAGIALFMYYYNISQKVSIILFLILSMLLIKYYIAYGNFTYIFSISRNYVSVFLLCFFTILCVFCSERRKTLNIFALMVLLFSCMAGGRGGILASVILNLFCFGITMRYDTGYDKVYYILGSLLAGILLMFVLQFRDWTETVHFFIGKFAYTGFGVDSDRISLYTPYIQECGTFENLLFGTNIKSILDTHLHNTYLMAHARFGIIGLCIFIVLFTRAVIYSWKTGNKMLAALILTIMVRIFTDSVFTITSFDSIFFYILFLGLNSYTRGIKQYA